MIGVACYCGVYVCTHAALTNSVLYTKVQKPQSSILFDYPKTDSLISYCLQNSTFRSKDILDLSNVSQVDYTQRIFGWETATVILQSSIL